MPWMRSSSWAVWHFFEGSQKSRCSRIKKLPSSAKIPMAGAPINKCFNCSVSVDEEEYEKGLTPERRLFLHGIPSDLAKEFAAMRPDLIERWLAGDFGHIEDKDSTIKLLAIAAINPPGAAAVLKLLLWRLGIRHSLNLRDDAFPSARVAELLFPIVKRDTDDLMVKDV